MGHNLQILLGLAKNSLCTRIELLFRRLLRVYTEYIHRVYFNQKAKKMARRNFERRLSFSFSPYFFVVEIASLREIETRCPEQ